MRVGRKGYITTPSALSEKLFGWEKHVWFVGIEDGILTLRAKERTLYDRDLSSLFHKLYRVDPAFRRFSAQRQDLFVVEYWWNGEIRHRIDGDLSRLSDIKIAQAQFEFDLVKLRDVLAQRQRNDRSSLRPASVARRLMSGVKLNSAVDALERLACPMCRGHLIMALPDRGLSCTACGICYPVIEGVPILVKGAESEGRCA